MPEDVVFDENRVYPTPAFGLMDNPFPKKKPSKKKKKKRVFSVGSSAFDY